MAIYSDNDHGSIFQIKNYLCANSDTTAPSMHTSTQHRDRRCTSSSDRGGERLKLRFLPGAIQQLKMPPIVPQLSKCLKFEAV